MILVLTQAKKKPMQIIESKTLSIDLSPHLTVVSVEEPTKRSAGIKVENVQQLVGKLKSVGLL